MELRVVLTVPDFDEAVAFYRDALGFEQLADWSGEDGRVILLDAGRSTIELFDERQGKRRPDRGRAPGVRPRAPRGRGDRPRGRHRTAHGGGCGADGRHGRPAVGRPQRAAPDARRVAADTVQRALARFNGGVTTTALWDELLVGDELAHLATEPAREARGAPLPDSLQPDVLDALARRGIHELYAHQAEAFAAAQGGGNVIVTTGTASGKTLAFNLPVLDALAADRHAYLQSARRSTTGTRRPSDDARSAAGRTSC
jgi:catechol 2,3-dioxygenase-like lactoylglutathione lyase family enzyme